MLLGATGECSGGVPVVGDARAVAMLLLFGLGLVLSASRLLRAGWRGWGTLWRDLAEQWAAPVLIANLAVALTIFRGRRAIPRLSAAPPAPVPAPAWPRLSIVVPARNEAAGIRAAVESMLGQDYPDLELVLIDDRSDDGTGRIMAALAAEHPGRVRVLTVRELPPGWLGKNHALWLGTRGASGDWLLFADGDIVFDPGCCRRAVAYAEARGIDHLTLFPDYGPRGYWLRAFVAFFLYAFVASRRAYLASDPRSKVGAGVGAFNLIRRGAYEAIGTHRAIALRPDDDVRLGESVKAAGLRQAVLNGADLLRVEWYPSLRAALVGLDKTLYAGLDYSVAQVLGNVAALFFLAVAPYLLVWRAAGRARWLLLAALGLHNAGVIAANRQVGGRALAVLPAFPLAALLFCYAVIRSCARTRLEGGIRWRGTFYPLAELRRGARRPAPGDRPRS